MTTAYHQTVTVELQLTLTLTLLAQRILTLTYPILRAESNTPQSTAESDSA